MKSLNLPIKSALYVSAIFLPIGVLYYLIYSNAVNIPFMDDCYLFLGTTVNFTDAHTLREKIDVLFSQHNEHRPAFARAAAIACYYLKGKADFNLLIYFGNIALIGLAACLFMLSESGKDRVLSLVPTSFILFQPSYWENIQSAGGALSNIPAIVFSMLAIHMAAYNSAGPLAVSAIFAISAAFTHASGILVLPACLFVLAHQKRYGAQFLGLLLMAAVLTVYFSGYERPGYNPSIPDAVFVNPGNTARYLLSLLGAPLGPTGMAALIYALGVMSLSAMIWITYKKYYSRNVRIYAMLLFLFLVAAVIAISRSGFGVQQAFASRYRTIPLLILALECIAVMELKGAEKTRRYFALVLATALLFNIGAFFVGYKSMKLFRAMIVRGALEYRTSGAVPVGDEDREFVSGILVRSREMGIYDFPDSEALKKLAEQ